MKQSIVLFCKPTEFGYSSVGQNVQHMGRYEILSAKCLVQSGMTNLINIF